jgi:hypothetical protein
MDQVSEHSAHKRGIEGNACICSAIKRQDHSKLTHWALLVYWLANNIEDAAKSATANRHLQKDTIGSDCGTAQHTPACFMASSPPHKEADYHLDGVASVQDPLAPDQAIGRVHGNSADGVVANMLGNLQNQADVVVLHLKSGSHRRQDAIEADVHDGSNDLQKERRTPMRRVIMKSR